MSGPSPERGLLDTSVAIELESIELTRLPKISAISSLTLAELSAGPHAATSPRERARRQDNLQKIESMLQALPFDSRCARAYGSVYALVASAGRKPHGSRAVDLMIAATALANDLPLYTLNASDLRGLEGLVEVVDLG
ncbi:MAG: type II toxin-antitoxin system VapC family toxin [Solirubrobacterales bacterium]|nr:type II toxin-antitoxin system VapC family toxin [Solirubrobacterales bacterium]